MLSSGGAINQQDDLSETSRLVGLLSPGDSPRFNRSIKRFLPLFNPYKCSDMRVNLRGWTHRTEAIVKIETHIGKAFNSDP